MRLPKSLLFPLLLISGSLPGMCVKNWLFLHLETQPAHLCFPLLRDFGPSSTKLIFLFSFITSPAVQSILGLPTNYSFVASELEAGVQGPCYLICKFKGGQSINITYHFIKQKEKHILMLTNAATGYLINPALLCNNGSHGNLGIERNFLNLMSFLKFICNWYIKIKKFLTSGVPCDILIYAYLVQYLN